MIAQFKSKVSRSSFLLIEETLTALLYFVKIIHNGHQN